MSRLRNRLKRASEAPASEEDAGNDALRDRYLELLAAAVTHTLYDPIDAREPPEEVKEAYKVEFKRKGITFPIPTDLEQRLDGRDRPIYAQTMIGCIRVKNLRQCVESVLADRVPGDLIEAGCWRGGAGIMMRGILEAHGVSDRSVWLADSFQGLPQPNVEKYPADAGDVNYREEGLAVSVDTVRANFERYGLLDERVHFLEGWFRDTLPTLVDKAWAVVRLDGDLYESTMDGLENLYPQLSNGGYMILDDFGFPNCREAVEDFRREHDITEPIMQIDWAGAYWRRTK
jgi:O-methyltransferase